MSPKTRSKTSKPESNRSKNAPPEPRKSAAKLASEVWALRRRGVTLQEISDRVGRSVSTVADAAKRGERAAAKRPRHAALEVPSAPDHVDAEPIEVLTWLDEQLHMARTDQVTAQADKDALRAGRAGKAIHALLALRARYTPPAPVDANERPDMVALAKSCRERLLAYSARAADLRATWPRCGQCGQPVEPTEAPAS